MVDEWKRACGYPYTVASYSAIKNSAVLSFAATRMILEDIVLSETSQHRKKTADSHLRVKA